MVDIELIRWIMVLSLAGNITLSLVWVLEHTKKSKARH